MDVLARVCVAAAVIWHLVLAALIANLIWFADSTNGAMGSVVGVFYLVLAGTVVIPAGLWGFDYIRRGQSTGR
jgi:hypothetical protein